MHVLDSRWRLSGVPVTEVTIRAELRNIMANEPLWPGDTLSHETANECVRRGWARRDADGDFITAGLPCCEGGTCEFHREPTP